MRDVVCFTGAGGKATRAQWAQWATSAGFIATDSVQIANILVASRTNTSKAVTARARGIRVITYGEFEVLMKRQLFADPTTLDAVADGGLDERRREASESAIEQIKERKRAEKRKREEAEAAKQLQEEEFQASIESNPAWGMF